MSSAATVTAANPPPSSTPRRRPWYRLHAATWIVAALVALVLTVIVATPVNRIPGFADELIRGWPWPFASYVDESTDPFADSVFHFDDPRQLPAWLDWRLWSLPAPRQSLQLWVLLGDVVSATVIVAGIAAVFELWRRRRVHLWQLHLADLLMATLLVALASAWWIWWERDTARERQAEPRLSASWNRCYVGPAWLIRLTGGRFCPDMCLRLEYLRFTDLSVRPAETLTEDLRSCRFVKQLSVESCSFPDEAWSAVAELPLVDLHVWNERLSDDVLLRLAQIPTLRIFSSSGSGRLKDAYFNLIALSEMQSLTELTVRSERFPPGSAKHLAKLLALQSLTLSDTTTDDEGVQQLATLPRLQYLDLSWTHVTDAGVTCLADARNLRTLLLCGTDCTDGSLDVVKKIPTIKRLNVEGSAVTSAGVQRLRQARPDINVESDFDEE